MATLQLQYRKNGGAWTNITSSSANVRTAASPNVADSAATTNQMTAGTGTFSAGQFDEVDGVVVITDPATGNHTEVEFSLQLVSANLANGDVLDFRISGMEAIGPFASMTIGAPPPPPSTLNVPQLIVEIAFASSPFSTSPVWTDVSQWVLDASIRRGRQMELDRIEAGTLRMTLENIDRRFEPEFSGSPYYPNILPLRRIRVRAVHQGTTYGVFSGYIERWPIDWSKPGYSTVAITAVDAFELFNNDFREISRASEGAGAAITRTLDAAGWPPAEREIDDGSTIIPAMTTEGSTLQQLQNIADAESGLFFIDGDGKAVFHERHRRATATTSIATFGDGEGELEYSGINSILTKDLIRNQWRVTGVVGGEQIASDSTSIGKYLLRDEAKSVWLGTATEAFDLASYLVSRYKDPALRFESLRMHPVNDNDLWTQVLAREISDRITVARRPPGGDTAVVRDAFIEGIEHSIVPAMDWTTTFQVSPTAGIVGAYWILDDATRSVLDSTTKLIY